MFATRVPRLTPLVAALMLATTPALAQEDADRVVEDGGIHIPGWTGHADGGSLDQTRLAVDDGGALHVVTGPATTYWHPDNLAAGDYTVSATFHEPEYMNLNNHPHPYGVFIGGSDMGTNERRYLYCAAYGNGRFIVRGFGPEPFQMNGRRAEEHDAVNRAADRGEPVTQEVALTVSGDEVSCTINGTVVATYSRADVVGEGKLASTDGVYGIRAAHNTEVLVRGLEKR